MKVWRLSKPVKHWTGMSQDFLLPNLDQNTESRSGAQRTCGQWTGGAHGEQSHLHGVGVGGDGEYRLGRTMKLTLLMIYY